MKFVTWLGKALGWFFAHALQGTVTVVMSFIAIFSLFIFDNIALKFTAFIGSFAIVYLVSYFLGKVRGEHK